MGCFNGICELSNLPINYGDEVIVIPVMKAHKVDIEGLTTYPLNNYIPIGFPFKSTYNDYGGIENDDELDISDKNNKNIILSRDYYSISDEDKEDIRKETFSSVSELISAKHRRGRTLYTTYFPVEFIMYHAPIYRELLKENFVPENFIYCYRKHWQIVWRDLNDDYFSNFREFELGESIHRTNIIYNKKENEEYWLNKYTELTSLCTSLSILRRGFRCYSGEGSQNNDFEYYKKFNEIVGKFIDYKISKEKKSNSY